MMKTRDVLGFAAGPLVGAALGVVYIPVLAWAYSPAALGQFSVAQTVVALAVIVLSLGLDQAYVREYHESNSKTDVLHGSLWPALVALLVAVVAGLTSLSELSNMLFGLESVWPALITIACILVVLLSRFVSLVLRMSERGLAFSMSQVMARALLLLAILAVVVTRSPRGIESLLLVFLFSSTAALALYGWTTRAEWARRPNFPGTYRATAGMLRFGIPLMIASVSSWALTGASVFALRAWSSFDELGILSVTTSVAGVVGLVQAIFAAIWAPIVYKWVSQGGAIDRVRKAGRQALVVILALTATSGSLAWLARLFLPESYADVPKLVPLAVLPALLYLLSEITSVGIGVARRSSLALVSSVAALLLCVAGNYLLVPEYGARGALVATAGSYWLLFAMRSALASRVWQAVASASTYALTALAVLAAGVAAWGSEGRLVQASLCWFVVLVLIILRFHINLKKL